MLQLEKTSPLNKFDNQYCNDGDMINVDGSNMMIKLSPGKVKVFNQLDIINGRNLAVNN